MNADITQQAISWVQQNVDRRMSKGDIVLKAQGSHLPLQAMAALEDLPNREYDRDEAVAQLQQEAMSGAAGSQVTGEIKR
jgi:hypothetical protein